MKTVAPGMQIDPRLFVIAILFHRIPSSTLTAGSRPLWKAKNSFPIVIFANTSEMDIAVPRNIVKLSVEAVTFFLRRSASTVARTSMYRAEDQNS